MTDNEQTQNEMLKQLQEMAKAKAKQGTCPSCGRCPTCGRGGIGVAPTTPYIPHVPYVPWNPWGPTWQYIPGWVVYNSGTTDNTVIVCGRTT